MFIFQCFSYEDVTQNKYIFISIYKILGHRSLTPLALLNPISSLAVVEAVRVQVPDSLKNLALFCKVFS